MASMSAGMPVFDGAAQTPRSHLFIGGDLKAGDSYPASTSILLPRRCREPTTFLSIPDGWAAPSTSVTREQQRHNRHAHHRKERPARPADYGNPGLPAPAYAGGTVTVDWFRRKWRHGGSAARPGWDRWKSISPGTPNLDGIIRQPQNTP